MKEPFNINPTTWRILSVALGALLPVLYASCTVNSSELPPNSAVLTKTSATEKLVNASYYGDGDGTDGEKTANGETFDANALTAAHANLPFHTKLKVTNPKNGKAVQVRINDRGPFKKGRALDLSAKAASQIGLKQDGVGPVKMLVLPEAADAKPQAAQDR